MKITRSSGVLLHPTSLPGRFGIGELGAEAHQFIEFLAASGQGFWQVLPLGPVGYGNSPYQCFSAFAGNTLLISLQKLADEGLLMSSHLADVPPFPADHVDYGPVIEYKNKMLWRAFENFRRAKEGPRAQAFHSFCQQAQAWLDDYALFSALKDEHQGAAWYSWSKPLARREKAALAEAHKRLSDVIESKKFYQYLFYKQWFELKNHCHARNLRIIGDLPIFVAYDSVDVWQQPDQFKVDKAGKPTVVAGVPPDAYSDSGQLWGNPLYNWDRMRTSNFRWWIQRMRAMMEIFDIVRLDHFRGFAACWEVPANAETAASGKWVAVPGRDLFTALAKEFGELPVIAEDLGVITPDVDELRNDFGFPGMRVLQFAFSGDSDNIHLPHLYDRNIVAYTGTHDNDTTVGWFQSRVEAHEAVANEPPPAPAVDNEEAAAAPAPPPSNGHEFCLKYLNTTGSEIHWDLIRAAFASVAELAIVPLQDLLGLDSHARMNFPSSSEGNWAWRFEAARLNEPLSMRLKELSELYGRRPNRASE